MQNTADESRFIPISCERGKARQINKIRLAYSLLRGLKTAHSRRLFLFRNEGQGYKNALSYSHNHIRFRNVKTFLPLRERVQEEARKEREKNEGRRKAIIALRYGKRYGTTTMQTIERARAEGIRIRPNGLVLPYADIKNQLAVLISSGMKG